MEEFEFESDFSWEPTDNNKYDSGNGRIDNYNGGGRKDFSRTNFKFSKPEKSRIMYIDGGSRMLNGRDGKREMIGAWSFYDTESGDIIGEAKRGATNNQMELYAAIKALEYLNHKNYPSTEYTTIKCDSEYVRYGIIYWVKKWAKNNWVRIDKEGKVEQIKNLELWKKLYELSLKRKIYWEHVKAHSGDEGNEKVDTKCTSLIEEEIKKINMIG